MKSKVVLADKEAAAAEEPSPKGIPEFWFTIFRNVDMLSELVQVSAPPWAGRDALAALPTQEWSRSPSTLGPRLKHSAQRSRGSGVPQGGPEVPRAVGQTDRPTGQFVPGLSRSALPGTCRSRVRGPGGA